MVTDVVPCLYTNIIFLQSFTIIDYIISGKEEKLQCYFFIFLAFLMISVFNLYYNYNIRFVDLRTPAASADQNMAGDKCIRSNAKPRFELLWSQGPTTIWII